MKTKLLAGVALAVILGVSSAAYANPKNSFNNGPATNTVTSTAANIQIGNISAGNGTTSATGGAGGGTNGIAVGVGNGDTTQGDSTNIGIANSESFNVEGTGQSQQTLLGVSVLNIQANVAASTNTATGGSASNSQTSSGNGNSTGNSGSNNGGGNTVQVAGSDASAENEDNNALAVLVNGGATSSIGNNNGGIVTSSAASGVGAQNNVGISVGAGGVASF
jgi:hypothetical protein